ncbi:MAG: 50S ribosomal protein L13 [Actinomycetota bacterium]|nr:50S ribosomal protein L13 [Actinomycetota bacterium]MDP9020027.1 50S ribosomal protein L13 [Actinomycetota bacterium]
MPTFAPTRTHITRAWHLVDADGLVLGRLATEVARLLRGKHKPTYAPNLDTGDHVIVVNADKVVLTADKGQKKVVYHHTGYPGGIRSQRYDDFLARKPEEAVRKAVRGMLPKNSLGRSMLRKLKVYAGPTHPHAAQNPSPLELSAARRQPPAPVPKES